MLKTFLCDSIWKDRGFNRTDTRHYLGALVNIELHQDVTALVEITLRIKIFS